ncbi:MAG: hypothetical protein KBC42_01545 [Candidatus Pacebacteria bacterium]|jgi:thiosulfate dehydrogenase [quinone] large subunit|nr:hypothetical protein [Candidatus Paceibacterota bacterium]MBP9780590.1 hypothetical protein [Candidatus Paceibacterota bacterium]
MKNIISGTVLLKILRVLMGFTFLWAFLDKTFGLGFATKPEAAWLQGGSPTTGFLTHAVRGPFESFFSSLAGVPMVDWLFMLGLLGIGLTLLLNKYVKWGALAGIVMLVLMYLAVMWPENNPLIDEHLIYAVLLAYIAVENK